MGKYRLLGTFFDRVFRNDLNANFEDVDTDIQSQKKRVDDLIVGTPQPSEVVDARGGFPVLRDRLDDVASQMAQKPSYDESRLMSVKLGQTDMTEEFLQQMAGTTPINAVVSDNVVTQLKIAPKAVTKGKLNFVPITGVPSKNVFDKNSVISGYIDYQTGNVVASSTYSVSDYISVEPSTDYAPTTSYQLAFYDANLAFISGLGINTYTTFTTPVNAVFVRITVKNTDLNIFQLEKGTVKTEYVSAEATLLETSLEQKLKDKLGKPNYLTRVMNNLENTFSKTKIVLIGDSITAGAGGTGYSTTNGEIIGSTTEKTNNPDATCFANMLINLITSRYNKDHLISPTNPAIKDDTTNSVLEYFNLCTLQWRKRLYNLSSGVGTGLSLKFHGDHFEVIFMKKTNTGIFEVKVDGVSKGIVDTYATSTSYGNKFTVTGLTLGEHTIEILQTGTKNASSTANDIYVEGFTIPKTAIVKNYGISGKTSEYFYVNKEAIIPNDTDVLIMQLGTNDRKTNSPDVLKTYQREIIKYAQGLGMKVILMSSIPSSLTDENQDIRKYHMNDVNTAIRQLADEFNMDYISNYNWFMEYISIKGIMIDALLDDGLHPNDEGHKLMFQNIARKLGLSEIQDGIIYYA